MSFELITSIVAGSAIVGLVVGLTQSWFDMRALNKIDKEQEEFKKRTSKYKKEIDDIRERARSHKKRYEKTRAEFREDFNDPDKGA